MDYEKLIESLIAKGFFYQEDFLNTSICLELLNELKMLPLKNAKIGKGQEEKFLDDIRNDAIFWLDETPQSLPQRHYLHEISCIKDAINRELYLGLKQYEGHFAFYKEGGFYKKHLDQFVGNNERLVSIITYLNTPAAGGELRIYKKDAPNETEIDIAPKAGTLVCFLSNQIYHEVLPTKNERYSITGWLRTTIR